MSPDSFFSILQAALFEQLSGYQLLLLQTAGQVGIFSIFLILRSKSKTTLLVHLGWVAGFTNLVMAFAIEQWLHGAVKPFLRNDLLLISGFFGGWSGASIAGSLTLIGRLAFSEPVLSLEAFLKPAIDIFFVAYGAVIVRFFFREIRLEKFSALNIFFLSCLRIPIVTIPILVNFIFGFFDSETALRLTFLRISSNFVLSFPLLLVLVFLLKRELERERQIYIDPLSLLPNRRAFHADVSRKNALYFRAKKQKKQLLLLVEITNLNELVLVCDHVTVDKIFKKLAEFLSGITLKEPWVSYAASVYYFSDQGFAVVLDDIDTNQVREIGIPDILLNKLRLYNQESIVAADLRFSIGVVDVTAGEPSEVSAFIRALSMMERNPAVPVYYFQSSITKQLELDNHLRIQIEAWIREGNVPVWLQPKMHLSEGHCVGAEALLRVQHEGHFVSPPQVLQVARRHHLLADLEWAIIETVVRQLRELPDAYRALKFSVNISPVSLIDTAFSNRLDNLLKSYDISGEKLIIELIETSRLSVTEVVQNNVSGLLSQGVAFSMDDFGSGYASLSLLAKLPFSELKLDYAMISGLGNPRVDAAIQLAIDGARQYQARVVAEGIETEEQRRTLVKMGIESGQGFLFSKAIPFADFVAYIQAGVSPPEEAELESGLRYLYPA